MSELIMTNEPILRLSFFVGILVLLGIFEVIAPRRRREIPRLLRWTNNLGVLVLNTFIVRLAFPLAAVGFALIAKDCSWGLLNVIETTPIIAFVASLIILDFAIYLQHVMLHAIPAFWRLHRMHHADLEFDLTTGLRFHPLEILLSMGIKLTVVAILGPPAVAVLVFEIVLNATAMFNHSNIHIPRSLEAILRLFVVTPDMHRVHHSIRPDEYNTNFGFNIPWWDKLLGTYSAQPVGGHKNMTIGLNQFRSRRDLRLDQMLMQPAKGPANKNAIDIKREEK